MNLIWKDSADSGLRGFVRGQTTSCTLIKTDHIQVNIGLEKHISKDNMYDGYIGMTTLLGYERCKYYNFLDLEGSLEEVQAKLTEKCIKDCLTSFKEELKEYKGRVDKIINDLAEM